MKTTMILMTILIVAIVSCNARKGWWRRTKKSVSIKPEVGSGGKWAVKGSLTITFRKKRDLENQGKFNVDLRLDPCERLSYDTDRDGLVTMKDMKDIFGDTELVHIFFDDADEEEKDGQLSEKEFTDFSKYINGCEPEPTQNKQITLPL